MHVSTVTLPFVSSTEHSHNEPLGTMCRHPKPRDSVGLSEENLLKSQNTILKVYLIFMFTKPMQIELHVVTVALVINSYMVIHKPTTG